MTDPDPIPIPAPPAGVSPTTKPPNPYRTAGWMLLLANIIPGLLLYALVASLIGEDRLEGVDSAPFLGTVLVYLPPVVGLVLLLFGRRIAGVIPPARIRWPLVAATVGAVFLIVGLIGVASGNGEGDANIGGGLLVLAGPVLLLGGLIANFRRR